MGEPDARAYREMAVYDRLPPNVRDMLKESGLPTDPLWDSTQIVDIIYEHELAMSEDAEELRKKLDAV